MTNQTIPSSSNQPREIAPFNPEAKGPELSIDEIAIAVDEIENLVFAANSMLMEKNDNSQEIRSALAVLGAMQPHIATMKKHCSQ